ncbi:MAG: ATP-dependent helicase [Dethiobacteria bacterium]
METGEDRKLLRPRANADPAWSERLRCELNEAQFKFATADDAVILGLAGPGSGKTRALVYRAAHLIKCGVPPGEILLLTFTNKAAEEMKERLSKLLGSWPEGLWAGTFHSIGARILRRHAPLVRRKSNFSILDEDDSRSIFRQLAATLPHGLDEEERRLLLRRGLLGRMISRARNSGLSLREVMADEYTFNLDCLPLVEKLALLYEQKKEEANAFDFDDLLLRWLELFEEHPEIKEHYRERFAHVLVDEFQDTNIVQARLVDQFAGAASICAVGDDAQSIYAFRFAHVGNILSFPEKYPQALVVRMEQNYRSTPEIVALANASIAFNRVQLPKKLFSQNFPGEKPLVVGARDAGEEASFVLDRIMALHRGGLPLKEMAVLYRSAFLSTEVEFALVRQGIPYRTFGGVKFLQKSHIKDILAYLKVLHNPVDAEAWRRLALLQPGLGQATFNRLWNDLKESPDPLGAALSGRVTPARGKEGWRSLCRTLEALRARLPVAGSGESGKKGNGIAGLIAEAMDGNYEQILQKNYPDQYEERLRGIERLAENAARYDSLGAFLESLALEESLFADAAASERIDGDYLTLSTVHSAKGKEWEAVFVIGLNEGSFPSHRAGDEELPEERRLFYVAVTRARRYLYLSTYWADYRSWGPVTGEPSLFLKELPQDCFEAVLIEGTGFTGS